MAATNLSKHQFDLPSPTASKFSNQTISLVDFINYKPRRSYSCFREVSDMRSDDSANIKKLASCEDLEKARLDIRAKWRDLVGKTTPVSASKACDVVHIESVFGVVADAINHAEWAFDAANRAIAAASESTAAVYNDAAAAM